MRRKDALEGCTWLYIGIFSEWCGTYNPGLAIVIRQGPLAAIWWIRMS